MIIKYFDTHCHLQFDAYDTDREELIERMRAEGIAGIVVGVDCESSEKAVALAEKHEHLYASAGLHPNHVQNERYDISYYRTLASSPKVVAIGECGLDYYRPSEVNEEVKEKQKETLQKHIALAVELGKPLIIHCRPSKGAADAYRDLIQILGDAKAVHPRLCSDIHFFVGGAGEAWALIALGFTLSFTAVITFARDYDEIIKAVPLESILGETDAPYVAPAVRRGKRNDPLAIRDVAAKLADIRAEDPQTIRAALVANAERLFVL